MGVSYQRLLSHWEQVGVSCQCQVKKQVGLWHVLSPLHMCTWCQIGCTACTFCHPLQVLSPCGDKLCHKVHSLLVLSPLHQQHYNLSFLYPRCVCVCMSVFVCVCACLCLCACVCVCVCVLCYPHVNWQNCKLIKNWWVSVINDYHLIKNSWVSAWGPLWKQLLSFQSSWLCSHVFNWSSSDLVRVFMKCLCWLWHIILYGNLYFILRHKP